MASAGPEESKADDVNVVTSVLDYWFGDLLEQTGSPIPEEFVNRWFKGVDGMDAEIKAKFGQLVTILTESVKQGNDASKWQDKRVSKWIESPKGRLAIIILCDQFTRNIYRGSAQSFACDPFARSLILGDCEVAAGKDAFDEKYINFVDLDVFNSLYELQPICLQFYLMPLTHSEDLKDQKRAVRMRQYLLDRLKNDASKSKENEAKLKSLVQYYEYTTAFIVSHMKDIEKFGRFPYRNEVLGRESTAEELEYVKEHGNKPRQEK